MFLPSSVTRSINFCSWLKEKSSSAAFASLLFLLRKSFLSLSFCLSYLLLFILSLAQSLSLPFLLSLFLSRSLYFFFFFMSLLLFFFFLSLLPQVAVILRSFVLWSGIMTSVQSGYRSDYRVDPEILQGVTVFIQDDTFFAPLSPFTFSFPSPFLFLFFIPPSSLPSPLLSPPFSSFFYPFLPFSISKSFAITLDRKSVLKRIQKTYKTRCIIVSI